MERKYVKLLEEMKGQCPACKDAEASEFGTCQDCADEGYWVDEKGRLHKGDAFSDDGDSNESKVNEGHSGESGPIPGATSKEEAMSTIKDEIQNSKDDEGDLRYFTGPKWVGTTTEDNLDKQATRWEGEFVAVGLVDGEYWMARWTRD